MDRTLGSEGISEYQRYALLMAWHELILGYRAGPDLCEWARDADRRGADTGAIYWDHEQRRYILITELSPERAELFLTLIRKNPEYRGKIITEQYEFLTERPPRVWT